MLVRYTGSGMMLLETCPDETEAAFRAAIDAVMSAMNPSVPGWWQPYEVRGTYEYRGVRFREFYCVAGSAQAFVWKHANKGGDRRAIMLPDESVMVFDPVNMVGRGAGVPVDAKEVRQVDRRYYQPLQRTGTAEKRSWLQRLFGRGPGR